jgi:Flp pilus assembly secretin CpaC
MIMNVNLLSTARRSRDRSRGFELATLLISEWEICLSLRRNSIFNSMYILEFYSSLTVDLSKIYKHVHISTASAATLNIAPDQRKIIYAGDHLTVV